MTTSNKPPLKLRPPRRCWIEFSSDCVEILATHGSQKEAEDNCFFGTVIAGPYILQPKPKTKPKPKRKAKKTAGRRS